LDLKVASSSCKSRFLKVKRSNSNTLGIGSSTVPTTAPINWASLINQAKSLCFCTDSSPFSPASGPRRGARALESKAQELESKAQELETEAASLEVEDYFE
jgi:hypothetical protein